MDNPKPQKISHKIFVWKVYYMKLSGYTVVDEIQVTVYGILTALSSVSAVRLVNKANNLVWLVCIAAPPSSDPVAYGKM